MMNVDDAIVKEVSLVKPQSVVKTSYGYTNITPTLADSGDDDSPKIYKSRPEVSNSTTQLTEVAAEETDTGDFANDLSFSHEMVLMNYLQDEIRKTGRRKGKSKYTRKRRKRK